MKSTLKLLCEIKKFIFCITIRQTSLLYLKLKYWIKPDIRNISTLPWVYYNNDNLSLHNDNKIFIVFIIKPYIARFRVLIKVNLNSMLCRNISFRIIIKFIKLKGFFSGIIKKYHGNKRKGSDKIKLKIK